MAIWTLWLVPATPPNSKPLTVSGLSPDLSTTFRSFPSPSANDSSNISPHINYQWASGWVAADELVVTAYQFTNDSPFIYASETAGPATVTAGSTGGLDEAPTTSSSLRPAAPTNIAGQRAVPSAGGRWDVPASIHRHSQPVPSSAIAIPSCS